VPAVVLWKPAFVGASQFKGAFDLLQFAPAQFDFVVVLSIDEFGQLVDPMNDAVAIRDFDVAVQALRCGDVAQRKCVEEARSDLFLFASKPVPASDRWILGRRPRSSRSSSVARRPVG
jgi:hypothetical protein